MQEAKETQDEELRKSVGAFDSTKKRRSRPASPPIVSESPIPKASSRFGRTLGRNRIFEKDPRWREKDNEVGPPQYLLPSVKSERESAFGTSTREDWGKMLGTIPKTNPNAGPGSYKVVESMVMSSEMPCQPRTRFGAAVRPSMDMKTLGPGPIYDMDGKFKSGKDYPHKIQPGFNLDKRKPLIMSATDAMYHPALPKGKSCTIKQRRQPSVIRQNQMRSSPAPHDYDVVGAYNNLQKQPAFSFGKGATRFKGEDKVTAMMRKLEDANEMEAFMQELPSVSTIRP